MIVTTVFHISMKADTSTDTSTTNILIFEHCFENDIMIYDEAVVTTQIKNVIAVYLKL